MLDNYTTWHILHTLCILTQIGLLIMGFMAFVMASFENKSLSRAMLPWAASGIAMLGLGVNEVVYVCLHRVQKPIDESNQKRDKKIRFAFIISIFANLVVAAADFAIAAAIGTKISGGGNVLAAPFTLGAIAGLMALGTVFVDIIQLKTLSAQNQTGNIVYMQASTSDESVNIGQPSNGL